MNTRRLPLRRIAVRVGSLRVAIWVGDLQVAVQVGREVHRTKPANGETKKHHVLHNKVRRR
ncbi:uncharacterized protein TRAVEDRAFT_28312 [Trametes versicolor FP-101664 SS1]|uniref:uncharacterized protein n=1 Tax=Trametes versicolor (strain FP-101664) TaxID=717944 RepID=UPI00046245C9|nr:uncharacterized protein TRAVEDRAFT_28312 [Trametes versicolor FP-101664 SS1]EIW60873.1 hypothetical protein TRAVEDRAFT_28312 [Trametes versicolor FP-101664 SS1]